MSKTKRSPGRPRLYDEAATARIDVHVTPAQRLELRRIATASGTGISGVVREAVNCYVSDYGERLPFRRRR